MHFHLPKPLHRSLIIGVLIAVPVVAAAGGQEVPVRDPHAPGYVKATELPDGAVPNPAAEGNFIVGSTHPKAPEMTPGPDVPRGTVYTFTMRSADSRTYPGIAREPGTFGTPDPANPARLIVTTSHAAPYERKLSVYVPAQYVRGTAAPFIVGMDGPDPALFAALDSLIAERRVPPMIAISIGNDITDGLCSSRDEQCWSSAGMAL